MSDPRAFTGQMSAAQEMATRALSSPEGVYAQWTVDKYGSLDACKRRARSLQTSFSSLRARVRRLQAAEKNARDIFTQGPYDKLACVIDELPTGDGWQCWIGPASRFLDELDIIDCATGLPITEIGANRSPRNRFIDEVLPRAQKEPPQITRREWLEGERLGVWVNIDGTRWFGERGPTEEELGELDANSPLLDLPLIPRNHGEF